MKHWNKLLALLMAMVMTFGMTVTAFAAEGDDSESTPVPISDTADTGDTDSAPAALNYTDVSESNWYFGAVSFVTEKKLVDGLTETTFGPSENMTRQMLATALYRMAGSPAVTAENPFTDVADDAAYKNAVVWAYSVGVVTGVTETTFSPDSSIQRQAIAAMLARYLKVDTTEEGDLSAFADADQIQNYAKAAMTWAAENDLIKGNDKGLVDPRGNATRAQVATILERFAPMAEGKAPGADAAAPAGSENKDEATTPADSENKDEATTPAGNENKDEATTPADSENKDEATTPADSENKDEATTPADSENKDEAATPAGSENKDDTTTPTEGENEDNTSASAEGENNDDTAKE